MTFLRMPAAQIFDAAELQLWQPVPGKRTLTQDLPMQRKATSALEAAAAVRAAISAEGSGPMRAAAPPVGASDAVTETTAVVVAPPAASRQLATELEDPFALHLMEGQAAAPARPVVQRKAVSALPGLGASSLGPEASEGSGGGQPLPEALRAKMDAAFDFDFSSVRVHEGEHASGLGALAYAQGTELHFAPGQYDPSSERGQELIGHELAHVVQQAQGRVRATAQGKGAAINDDAGLEREADELGARAARGERAGGGGATRAVASRSGESAEPMQLRKVSEVVPGGAVVTASRGGNWMLVQGLDLFGFANWHLTIFPSGQESWKGTYALPAKGTRGVGAWMQFDEFHLTYEGMHFFYTDGCVPLAGSMSSSGKSPAWSHEGWKWANWVCASYFGVSQTALDEYVTLRPQQEKAERDELQAEQRHQDLMWKRYMHWVKQCPEMYAKTQKTFEQWCQEVQGGFRGTYAEFREQIVREEHECGGKLPDYPKRRWREELVEMCGEMVEVFGYEEGNEGGMGGLGGMGSNKDEQQ